MPQHLDLEGLGLQTFAMVIGGALTLLTADGPNDFVERRRDPLVSEAHEQGLVLGHCQPLGAEWLHKMLGKVSGKDISGSIVLGHCQPLCSWLTFLLHGFVCFFFVLGFIGSETP